MSSAANLALPNFSLARRHMIDSQLRPNKVRDEALLSAFALVPREAFVPSGLVGFAYIDEDLEVAKGRYLLEPMVLGRLLQEAALTPNDNVLDLAPATGYSTAILAHLAKSVVAVEPDGLLVQTASKHKQQLGLDNVSVEVGLPTEGYPASAPYDVILVNGAVEFVPQALLSQLAEGGRLVAVYQTRSVAAVVGQARIYEKFNGQISHRNLFDANVKLLADFVAPSKFDF